MRWLTLPVRVLATAALLGGCGSDSTAASAGGGGEGSTGAATDGGPTSTSTSTSTSPDADTDTDADTDAEGESSSSSGGDDIEPLDHEDCEGLPSGDQTPEALEIAEAIEVEIANLGRADDIALLDFGIKLGEGAGGADIFCLSLALHADWFVSKESLCIQDIDLEVVVAEVSDALASAPSMPSLAPVAEVEAAAEGCIGAYTYTPCRSSLGFLDSTFDPSVLSFSTGEEVGDCTYTSTRVNLDTASAEVLSCESDSTDTCDTEG